MRGPRRPGVVSDTVPPSQPRPQIASRSLGVDARTALGNAAAASAVLRAAGTRLGCDHAAAVPVESIVTGEILAALCPACGEQLTAAFLGCAHDNAIDTGGPSDRPGSRNVCNDCGTTGAYGSTDPGYWPGAMF